jgi:ribosomal-protein-alanine N-acetyltransferase
MTTVLRTARLELLPMTIGMVEAVLQGRRDEAEHLARAEMPDRWPNHELIERAFAMTLESIRADPDSRLWGARVMVASDEGATRRVVGSIVFRGAPQADGTSEIAYGVEEGSQGRGYATEGVGASVAWALSQSGVRAVQATTFAWHRASVRVLEKIGMTAVGAREHETMGEMLVYELRADRF